MIINLSLHKKDTEITITEPYKPGLILQKRMWSCVIAKRLKSRANKQNQSTTAPNQYNNGTADEDYWKIWPWIAWCDERLIFSNVFWIDTFLRIRRIFSEWLWFYNRSKYTGKIRKMNIIFDWAVPYEPIETPHWRDC
jgi:hypothetical protein